MNDDSPRGGEPAWPTGDDPDVAGAVPTGEPTGAWRPQWDDADDRLGSGPGWPAGPQPAQRSRHRLEDTGLAGPPPRPAGPPPSGASGPPPRPMGGPPPHIGQASGRHGQPPAFGPPPGRQQPPEHATEMMPLSLDDVYHGEPQLLTHRADQYPGADDDAGGFVPRGPDDPGGGGGGGGGGGDDGFDDEPDPRRARRKRRWKIARRSLYGVVALLILAPAVAFFILYQTVDVPSPEAIMAKQEQPVTFYWANGQVMDKHNNGTQNRRVLKPNEIPTKVKHAVEAAEDASFETNNGFSVTGILHAVWKQVTGGDGGGSTISQQFVKKATGNDEHSYVRKFKELVTSVKLNNQVPKPEIMAGYLNIIYFGRGAYGIGAAAQAYFGTDVAHLSTAQAAYLAGLIQGPSRSDDADYVKARWNYVMDQMVQNHWLSPQARQAATLPKAIPPSAGQTDYLKNKPYLHYVEQRVKDELQAKGLSEDTLRHNGAKIYLTLNPKAEQMAAAAAHKIMAADKEYKYLMSALVAANPKNGEIVAYYGGDWDRSQIDMANTPHMPGSSFKPIDFASAMQHDPTIGIGSTYDGTDDQMIAGTPVHNAGGEDCGKKCSVQRGMTKSVNTVFYNMAVQLGTPKVRKTAWELGISKQRYDPSCKKNVPTLIEIKNCQAKFVGGGISIGQYEVKPRDMVQAYATLANRGNRIPLHFVTKVTDSSGQNVLYQAAEPSKQVLDPDDPNHGAQIARNVIQSMLNVAKASGTPLDGNRMVASKTGTAGYKDTEHNAAAWMIGFTPQIVTGVWVGNWNKPAPIYGNYHNGIGVEHHYNIYGREEPAYIWQEFMNNYLANKPEVKFAPFQPLGESTVTDALYPSGNYPPSVNTAQQTSADDSSDGNSSSSSEPTTTAEEPTEPQRPSNPPAPTQPRRPTFSPPNEPGPGPGWPFTPGGGGDGSNG